MKQNKQFEVIAGALTNKQDKLKSGENIATINGNDITKGGDIILETGINDKTNSITYFKTESEYNDAKTNRTIKGPNISYIEESNKILHIERPNFVIKANTDYLKAGIKSLYDAKIINDPDGITLEEMDTNYICYETVTCWTDSTVSDDPKIDDINNHFYTNVSNKYIDTADTKLQEQQEFAKTNLMYYFSPATFLWMSKYLSSSNDPKETTKKYLMLYGADIENDQILLLTDSYKKLDDYLKTLP